MSDFDFDISRSLTVKSDGAFHIWFPIISNSHIWPTSSVLRDISLQNLSGFEIDLSGLLRYNIIIPLDSHIWFPIAV